MPLKLTSPIQLNHSSNFVTRIGLDWIKGWAFGFHRAQIYYSTLPVSGGLGACTDQVLIDYGFNLAAIKSIAECIPDRGPVLVTSNHPTGILDGALLFSILLSKRTDVRVVGNDALYAIPVLADRVLGVQKSRTRSVQNRNVLLSIRRAWKSQECIIAFPSGTVAHWSWKTMRVEEALWASGIQGLASKLNVPEYRATISIKNPLWFHCLASISRAARNVLLLQVFLANTKNHPTCPIVLKRLGS